MCRRPADELYQEILALAGFGRARDTFPDGAPPTLRQRDAQTRTGNSYFPWPRVAKADHVLALLDLQPLQAKGTVGTVTPHIAIVAGPS